MNHRRNFPDSEEPPSLVQLQSTESPVLPSFVGGSERLASLLNQCLAKVPADRPTALQILSDPYFTVSLLKDLVENHQLIESNQKVEAFRMYAHEVLSAPRNPTLMSVVRTQMVESVTSILPQIVAQTSDALLAPFFVVFRGESGIDEGGLTTEMFNCYFQQIVTHARALVSSDSGEDSDTVDPEGAFQPGKNYLPSSDPNIPSSVFNVFGMMMLKALISKHPLPVSMSTAVFKYLVGGVVALVDLEEYDKVVVRNLRRMLLMGEDELKAMSLDFDEFDEKWLAEFEGGAYTKDTVVTRANVAQYVNCKVQWELIGRRSRALKAMKEGFFSNEALRPHLQLLSATELQLLVCSQHHINPAEVVALLEFAQFPSTSNTPSMLKQLLMGFNQTNLKRFLRLCTSHITMPPSQNGRPPKIKVLCTADTRRLPVGHTCAFQLDLPDYNDEKILAEKLGIALAHANDGFNVV
jgi:hypothetical protein